LFLKNCAHCHGADAHGDDGPDLHGLDFSDDWIAGKLQPSDIEALIAYLHTLK
jgi:mono/diheme cytochrome c family protein